MQKSCTQTYNFSQFGTPFAEGAAKREVLPEDSGANRFGNGDRGQRGPSLYASDGARTDCKRQEALGILTMKQRCQSQDKARGTGGLRPLELI